MQIVWEYCEIDSKYDIWKKYKLLVLIYLYIFELYMKLII